MLLIFRNYERDKEALIKHLKTYNQYQNKFNKYMIDMIVDIVLTLMIITPT